MSAQLTIVNLRGQVHLVVGNRMVYLSEQELEIMGELLYRRAGVPPGGMDVLIVGPGNIRATISRLRDKLAPEYTITDGRTGRYKLEEL